jgi:hypothetical protein
MGTKKYSRNSNRQAASNKPTREEQTKFAADKFRWLRQIAFAPELPRIASQFAVLLLPYFNLEYDGVGWAGQDTLAEDLRCRREAVNRLFRLFVKHGHLTYKRGGWGRSNRYQMAFKEGATDVGKTRHQEQEATATDVRFRAHQEQSTDATDVRFRAQSDVRFRAQSDVRFRAHKSRWPIWIV